MNTIKMSVRKLSALCLLGTFSWSVASCGNAATPGQETPPSEYSVSLDSNGGLAVRDAQGEVLRGEPAQFPMEAKAIVDIQTITIVRALGSHYILIKNNGTTTKYYLKH